MIKNNINKNSQNFGYHKSYQINLIHKLALIIFLISSELLSLGVDETFLMDNLKTLSSKEFEGRKPGTEVFKLSEKFLSEKFKEIGLKDIAEDYKQEFDLTVGYNYDESSNFSFNVIIPKLGVPMDKIKPRINMLSNGVDWSPWSMSSNGSFSGEVAFLGYGITATDLNYDDYAGIDVNGKAVIILTNSPDGEKKESKFQPYTRYGTKIKNAINHGAKAIIFLKIQGDSANVFQPLEYFEYGDAPQIIAVQGNRTTISKYFPNTAQLMNVEQKINSSKQPNSFNLPNTTVSINVNLSKKMSKTSNIVGIIEGTDPVLKNEVVVIGAHYDHLGMGALNSQEISPYGKIHYGADDNASGTSSVIALAKHFAQNPAKRSIMFVLFTGEESGLLGSKYFVESELMKKYNVISMLNLDMIGRYKDDLMIGGIGSTNQFKEIVENQNANYKFKLKLENSGKGPSDHQSFYLKNIPVLFFFTGIHDDYHTSRDTYERIKKADYIKITNYILDVANYITNDNNKYNFIKVD